METLAATALILGALGLVFGLGGLILGGWALIEVQASKRSTHRITHLPVQEMEFGSLLPESTVEADIPPQIADQLPSPPEKVTATEYLRLVARQAAEDAFFEDDE